MFDSIFLLSWFYLASIAVGVFVVGVAFISMFRVSKTVRVGSLGAGAIGGAAAFMQAADPAAAEGVMQFARAFIAG